MRRRIRRSLKRYRFDTGDCFDASFAQIVSPVPAIPQIVGPVPPSYLEIGVIMQQMLQRYRSGL